MKRILTDPKFYFYTGVILLLSVLLPYFISFDYLLINSQGIFIQRELEITIFCFLTLLYFFIFKDGRQRLMLSCLFAFIIAFICYSCCKLVYDFSFDGQGYHQDAIFTIADGWNYFYETSSKSFHGRWIDHYPKSSWLSSAFYLRLFGNIEGAKFTNLLLVFSSLLICIPCLKKLGVKSTLTIVALSAMIAFDPINLNTFLSFMNDGQVSSLMLLVLLLSFNYRYDPSEHKLFLIGMCLIYLINIKLSASVYAIGIIASIFAYDLIKKQLRKQDEFYVTVGIALLLGFCLWGYNPYITNIKNQGHIFHPIYDSHSSNEKKLGADYLPSNFINDPTAVKVVKSLFAKTAFSSAFNTKAGFKAPFMVDQKELETYAANGVMLGGLGPLFSGLFIICLLLIFPLVYYFKRDPKMQGVIVIASLSILASVFLNPMGWWFRFVPQFWFFIVLVITLVSLITSKQMVLIRNILIGLAMINLSMMGAYVIYQPLATVQLDKRLTKLKKEVSIDKLAIDFGQHHQSFSRKLQDFDIEYSIKEEKKLLCPNPEEIKLLDVKFCLE